MNKQQWENYKRIAKATGLTQTVSEAKRLIDAIKGLK